MFANWHCCISAVILNSTQAAHVIGAWPAWWQFQQQEILQIDTVAVWQWFQTQLRLVSKLRCLLYGSFSNETLPNWRRNKRLIDPICCCHNLPVILDSIQKTEAQINVASLHDIWSVSKLNSATTAPWGRCVNCYKAGLATRCINSVTLQFTADNEKTTTTVMLTWIIGVVIAMLAKTWKNGLPMAGYTANVLEVTCLLPIIGVASVLNKMWRHQQCEVLGLTT